MKRIIKYIGLLIFAIIVLFMVLAVLIVFLALKSKSEGSSADDSQHTIFEYGVKEMPTFEEPEPIYADTMEEAITLNAADYFDQYPYMSKVSDIIKVCENEDYATMFYHSASSSEKDGIVASKFKVKKVNGKKQYSLILTNHETIGGKGRSKPLITARRSAPLYDYLAEFSINEGERFIFGSFDTEKVKTLKIEGQSPTEVIEYMVKDKKEYFWYYQNLISDKPSSEFDIEMEE